MGAPTVEQLASTVRKVRDALEAAGRDRYAARVYTLLTVITDATDELAQAKYEDYLSYASELGALVLNSGWMGVDLSQWDLDEPLGDVESNAIQSAAANIAAATGSDGSKWTIRDLARHTAIGGLGPVAVGGGATIADRLVEIQEQTDVDGFNLAYAVTPGTWEDVIEFVVPELRARGVYPEGYEPGSLRHKLHGRGDRLPAEHRGASFRVGQSAAVR